MPPKHPLPPSNPCRSSVMPDDLDMFAEAMVNDPPALDEVVADCERAVQSPDAEFEDADGVTVEVVVALTADGYAAVSLEDCVIVLRSPPEGPGAED